MFSSYFPTTIKVPEAILHFHLILMGIAGKVSENQHELQLRILHIHLSIPSVI